VINGPTIEIKTDLETRLAEVFGPSDSMTVDFVAIGMYVAGTPILRVDGLPGSWLAWRWLGLRLLVNALLGVLFNRPRTWASWVEAGSDIRNAYRRDAWRLVKTIPNCPLFPAGFQPQSLAGVNDGVKH
jgi:hypothetical protein